MDSTVFDPPVLLFVDDEPSILSALRRLFRRLERLEPGITNVKWGSDGSFALDDLGEVEL